MMKVLIGKGSPLEDKTACLVLGVWEAAQRSTLLQELDEALAGKVSRAFETKEFGGKAEQILELDGGSLPAERIVLVGLGSDRGGGADLLRRAAGSVSALLRQRKVRSFVCDLPAAELDGVDARSRVAAVIEGVALSGYRYDRYLTKDRDALPTPIAELKLFAGGAAKLSDLEAAATEALILSEAVCFARDLVNAPGNLKSPAYLADQAEFMAEETGLECRILEEAELERRGFGAMLGVAQGSARGPRLIVLEHRGGTLGDKPVALVGKGVVFDAGGISLKPGEKMDEMKMDMAGGAAVMGALMAAARLKLPVNLVGIVPAVENLPSGTAYRPGDILTSLSGKTIEVLNTDAEGRLILADALTYAREFEPALVVDVATLTGACLVALGQHASAVLGNEDSLIQQLLTAGERSGEKLWQLPLWPEYRKQLKSDFADIKNIGGRYGGTITAAAFLQEFAEGLNWAHLDIAGTAWEDSGRPCAPKGGTGFGVRLLVDFLRHRLPEADTETD